MFHFKPECVRTVHKIICSSLYEESFLELAFKDELVQEAILTILAGVLRDGGWYHRGVVLLKRWRMEIIRLESGDQGVIVLI